MSVLVAILWGFSSLAADLDVKSWLEPLPAEVLLHEVVSLKPKRGFHFNGEAPLHCGQGAAVVARSARLIQCQMNQAGDAQPAVSICDDQQTFCKSVKLELKVLNRISHAAVVLQKNESLNTDLRKILVPGFTAVSPAAAKAEVERRHQPVLVLISTDWCPSCNEAKEFLFSTPEFQMATAGWFKIDVDGDAVEASEWEKLVPYSYYPSLVILNSKFQEVSRYTGELRRRDVLSWLNEGLRDQSDPISALKERVEGRLNKALWQRGLDWWQGTTATQEHVEAERLLAWALDQHQEDLVARLTAHSTYEKLAVPLLSYRLDKLDAQDPAAGHDHKAEKLSLGEALLAATWGKEHWAEKLASVCEMDVATCKKSLNKIPQRLTQLGSLTDGWLPVERESFLADETFNLSRVYKILNDDKASEHYARECVDHYEAMGSASKALAFSRVRGQGMVACLELSRQVERERSTLLKLTEAYPHEPTFFLRMAKMLYRQKHPTEALAWIDRAESLAYGYNWFNLQLLKASIMLDQRKTSAADQTLRQILEQIDLDSRQESRDQELVSRVRGLQVRLASLNAGSNVQSQ